MSGGEICEKCMAMSDPGMALKPCGKPDCPAEKRQAAFAALFSMAAREQETAAIGATVMRPSGSNADEWHIFLVEHKDALPFLAVHISEAIEAAERRGQRR